MKKILKKYSSFLLSGWLMMPNVWGASGSDDFGAGPKVSRPTVSIMFNDRNKTESFYPVDESQWKNLAAKLESIRPETLIPEGYGNHPQGISIANAHLSLPGHIDFLNALNRNIGRVTIRNCVFGTEAISCFESFLHCVNKMSVLKLTDSIFEVPKDTKFNFTTISGLKKLIVSRVTVRNSPEQEAHPLPGDSLLRVIHINLEELTLQGLHLDLSSLIILGAFLFKPHKLDVRGLPVVPNHLVRFDNLKRLALTVVANSPSIGTFIPKNVTELIVENLGMDMTTLGKLREYPNLRVLGFAPPAVWDDRAVAMYEQMPHYLREIDPRTNITSSIEKIVFTGPVDLDTLVGVEHPRPLREVLRPLHELLTARPKTKESEDVHRVSRAIEKFTEGEKNTFHEFEKEAFDLFPDVLGIVFDHTDLLERDMSSIVDSPEYLDLSDPRSFPNPSI